MLKRFHDFMINELSSFREENKDIISEIEDIFISSLDIEYPIEMSFSTQPLSSRIVNNTKPISGIFTVSITFTDNKKYKSDDLKFENDLINTIKRCESSIKGLFFNKIEVPWGIFNESIYPKNISKYEIDTIKKLEFLTKHLDSDPGLSITFIKVK